MFSAFGAWQVWEETGAAVSEARVHQDEELGQLVAEGTLPPICRLWENGPALVVTRRETRLPRFKVAAHSLETEGWPVVVRSSGGTAVPHMAGMLNLSIAFPRATAPNLSIEEVYMALCAPIQLALRTLGIQTELGEVPGSFCDGRFNVVSSARKLAGTAQTWRQGLAGVPSSRGHVLAHATLHVNPDIRTATNVVNRFYELAGGDQRFDPCASTTIAACAEETSDSPAAGLADTALQALVREHIRNAIECLCEEAADTESS